MIERFEAQNFKSIKTLDLPMRQFMVLVGPNGAGKTNIVRAMELFGRILRAGTIDPIREAGYDQLIRRENKPARGGLYFGATHKISTQGLERVFRQVRAAYGSQLTAPQSLSVTGSLTVTGSVATGDLKIAGESFALESEHGRVEVKISPNGIFEGTQAGDAFLDTAIQLSLGIQPRRGQLDLKLRDVSAEVQRTIDPELQSLRLLNWQRSPALWLHQLRNSASVIRLRLESSALRQESLLDEQSRERILGPSGEGLAAAVYRIRGDAADPKPEFEPIISALRDVYPRIEDVRAERTGTGRLYLVFKERGIAQDLGQANVSDGVMHALALLLALHGGLGGEGILVIEEPENAIHPWSLRMMIARAQETTGRQIVLTTHSEIVVNEVRNPEDLWVVEASDAGTVVTPAIEREKALRAIMEKTGEKLGEIWLGGVIGGVPGAVN